MITKDVDLESPTLPPRHLDAECKSHKFESTKEFQRKCFYDVVDNKKSLFYMGKCLAICDSRDQEHISCRILCHSNGLQHLCNMLLDTARQQKIKLSTLRDIADLLNGT